MGYQRWSYETLHRFCKDVFCKFGFSEDDAEIIQSVLLTADMFGIESHGVQRMARYHKYIKNGLIQMGTQPEVVFDTPISAVIDGHDGMGQVISYRAMELAIKKAQTVGIGIVSVRNSNHYGIAGYYTRMASKEGLIGLCCTNSEAIMVPTNGRQAMIGSNPIACAFPAEPHDFFFDAASAVVPRGTLEVYNKKGEPLPEGWVLDKNGKPTTDAADVLDNIANKRGGGIMPVGGHKGYGYGIVCEIFSAILSMGTTSNYCVTGGKGNICHCFTAINPAYFGDPEMIKANFSRYMQELRESPKAEGQEKIYTHGDIEIERRADRQANGIPVNDNTMLEFQDLCDYLNMDYNEYFGS